MEKQIRIIGVSSPEGEFQTVLNLPGQGTMGSFASFVGFPGQGSLLLRTTDPGAFLLYVNGCPVPMVDIIPEIWFEADLSDVCIGGRNQLQACCIGGEDSRLELRIPYPELVEDTEAHEGEPSLQLLDAIIRAEIAEGFPSAQYALVRDGRLIASRAFGTVNTAGPGGPVTEETLFDLASNTKMYAANFALQRLVSEGHLETDRQIREYLPESGDRGSMTVRDLLQHQAGFPANPRYYHRDYDPVLRQVRPGSGANFLYARSREAALSAVLATPREYNPGERTLYSDADYMLLGFLVERITGKRLDAYCRETFYAPLGLTHTTFCPLEHGFAREDCAATELRGNTRQGAISFEGIRTGTLQGEVHDENAYYTMEGVSGHAGLFSTARELAVLGQCLLNRGGYGRHRLFDGDTVDRFLAPKASDPSFGLGWRRRGEGGYTGIFSPLAGPNAVGHTGWTGTLTLVDPETRTVFVLLTGARNTPLTGRGPDDFAGLHFLTGRYAAPAALALSRADRDTAGAMLAEFLRAKRALPDPCDADRACLRALSRVAGEYRDTPAIRALKPGWDGAPDGGLKTSEDSTEWK